MSACQRGRRLRGAVERRTKKRRAVVQLVPAIAAIGILLGALIVLGPPVFGVQSHSVVVHCPHFKADAVFWVQYAPATGMIQGITVGWPNGTGAPPNGTNATVPRAAISIVSVGNNSSGGSNTSGRPGSDYIQVNLTMGDELVCEVLTASDTNASGYQSHWMVDVSTRQLVPYSPS
jgi:hypothetical protein